MELKSTFLDAGVLDDVKSKIAKLLPYEKEMYVWTLTGCIEQDIGIYYKRIEDYESIEDFEDTENEIPIYRASMGQLLDLREEIYALIDKSMPPLDLSLFKPPF